MLGTLFEWFHSLYLHLGINFGLINDDPRSAEFRVTGLSFSPASPATIKVGDTIQVTISYKSNLKGKPVQIWAQPATEGLSGSYDPSGLESANGMVTRRFEVVDEGHLDSVDIQIAHYSGREMLYESHAVDYTLIANPEREALRDDGVGARVKIREVKVNRMPISPEAKIRTGESIDVLIDYRHNAQHEVRLWATATMPHEAPGRYDSGEMPQHKKQGSITKGFEFNSPTKIDGIYVHMVNVVDEVIAEEWLDFPIEFVR